MNVPALETVGKSGSPQIQSVNMGLLKKSKHTKSMRKFAQFYGFPCSAAFYPKEMITVLCRVEWC